MKNSVKVRSILRIAGIIALTAVIGFAFIACDEPNGKDNGKDTDTIGTLTGDKSSWWIELEDEGQQVAVHVEGKLARITVTGTPNPNRHWATLVNYQYTDELGPIEIGKRYEFTFKAWTESGTRELEINYIFSGGGTTDEVNYSFLPLTLTTEEQVFTRVTQTIPARAVDLDKQQFKLFCANQTGTFFVEMISVEETTEEPSPFHPFNWIYSSDDEPELRLTYTVRDDGVITVTRSGDEDPEHWWRAGIQFGYSGEIGKRYRFSFNAWTDSGTYKIGGLGYQYCMEEHRGSVLNDGLPLVINDDPTKLYTFISHEPIFTNNTPLAFYCANQNGTFHIRIIAIEETTNKQIPFHFSGKWIAEAATGLELTYTVNNDIITVTRSGAEFPEHWWRANIYFLYSGEIGKRHKFSFNAWTDSGTYEFGSLQYQWREGHSSLLNDGLPLLIDTNRNKVYTFISNDPLFSDDPNFTHLAFNCANQNGTFHIRMISIEETTD